MTAPVVWFCGWNRPVWQVGRTLVPLVVSVWGLWLLYGGAGVGVGSWRVTVR